MFCTVLVLCVTRDFRTPREGEDVPSGTPGALWTEPPGSVQ